MKFAVPTPENDPSIIYERLAQECPEFDHLRSYEPVVKFLFRVDPKMRKGRAVLGTCYMPAVQGDLSDLFDWLFSERFGDDVIYLITIDFDWWSGAKSREREALLFHELMHTGIATDSFGTPRFNRQTGLPIWTVRPHDVEAFNAEVARYGAWKDDIGDFLRAAGAMP